MKKCTARQKEIGLEFIEGREMTEAEMETVASILFTWWKRDIEQRMAEKVDEEKPSEPEGVGFNGRANANAVIWTIHWRMPNAS